ncbi:MAG: hypothetical protein HC903_02350 [Methylacidiphilales bacterium]|nr:hypothetical protein [Candidatus Methylacidiphilales bacterium]
MLLLAQINIGFSSGSIAGLFYILLGLIHLFFAIQQNRFRTWVLLSYLVEISFFGAIAANGNKLITIEFISWLPFLLVLIPFIFFALARFGFSNSHRGIFTEIFEIFIIPSLLILGGLILVFQGWRLDPILQMQAIWMLIIITYFCSS